MHSSALAALSENDECQACSSPPAATVSQPLAVSTGLSSIINIYQRVHAEGITAAPCYSPLVCLYIVRVDASRWSRRWASSSSGVRRMVTLRPRINANLSVSRKQAFKSLGDLAEVLPPSEEGEQASRRRDWPKFSLRHLVGPPWLAASLCGPSSETA